jgi:hypothetical protein
MQLSHTALLQKLHHYMPEEEFLAFERRAARAPRQPRVRYTAVDKRRAPAATMQPRVRRVYTTLAKAGPLTHTDLQSRLGKDFPYNTIRYAVQILRQAGLVDSERG